MTTEFSEIQRLCRVSMNAILQGMQTANIHNRQELSTLMQFYRNINSMAISAGRLEISLGITLNETKSEAESGSEVGTHKLIRPFAEGLNQRDGSAAESNEGSHSTQGSLFGELFNTTESENSDSGLGEDQGNQDSNQSVQHTAGRQLTLKFRNTGDMA